MAKEGFAFYLNNGFESCGSLEGGSERFKATAAADAAEWSGFQSKHLW